MSQKIAIIGGGIVGLSAGFYLAQSHEFQVSLFDKDKGQATKASGGVIAPWLSQRRNQAWYALVREGAKFYPQFIDDLGENIQKSQLYKQNGALIFKKKEKTLKKVYQIGLERRENAPEMGHIEILQADQVKDLLPIYDKKQPAIYVEGGARADGQLLVKALRDQLRSLNSTIINENVNQLIPQKNGYQLVTDQDTYLFDQVILANGAWIADLLSPLGFEVDTGPQKGQLAELFFKQNESDHWPVVMPAGGNNIIPFAGGRVLVGATHEKEDGFDTSIIKERVQPLLEDAANQLSDQFLQVHPTHYRVGIRAYSSDFSPYFGEIPELKGAYTANGLGATGLTAGPLIGKMLASMLQGNPLPLDKTNYLPSSYLKTIQ